MLTAPDHDWANPDYAAVFGRRMRRLARIRQDPGCIVALRTYYRDHPADFISDWGCTFDPRNLERGQPAVVPFLLFPRQREWIEWVLESWRLRRPGVSPKSRESGVSWLAVSLAATLALHHEGFVAGFGSRKEEYVDKIDSPKSLFWKARKFLEMLPREFKRGFSLKSDAPHMRIILRETGSVLSGEAGDNIGRGDRSSIYFVDESAHLEHPEITDASLSATTNCRIDIGTPNGMGNPFHKKVTTWPKERVFVFHWRDDPRKDDAWYAKQKSELDPIVVAQEIDIDFAASVEGVLIPSAWVQSAVDAAPRLGLGASGRRAAALDVADEGEDKVALCGASGMVVEHLEQWSGVGSDIFRTTQRAMDICAERGYWDLSYDADGLGAGVRGDARVVNEQRAARGDRQVRVITFRGSEGVMDPEREDVKGRKNIDYFANRKAQMWWHLRCMFQRTHRAVTEGASFAPDTMISLHRDLPMLGQLCAELSQPTYSVNGVGKIVVDKAPDGVKSPNLADSVMIRMARVKLGVIIPEAALRAAGHR